MEKPPVGNVQGIPTFDISSSLIIPLPRRIQLNAFKGDIPFHKEKEHLNYHTYFMEAPRVFVCFVQGYEVVDASALVV